MAQDQDKPSTGGNKPKPGNSPASTGSQSAKDKSRAQSRPVSGKPPAGKSGKAAGVAKGGNTPKPGGAKAAPAAAPRRLSGAMMAWGAVALVVVVIVVLVIVKVSGGSSTTTDASYTPVTPAPAGVVHDVTNIPLSVYDKVGVTSSIAVNPPTIVTGQPPLTLDGGTPAMFFYGAEYCPYCAAERWAITAALSRFGTWSDLKITASSHTDVDAETHTFSFYGASFTSPYITFKGVEAVSNVPSGDYYTSLMKTTAQENKIFSTYYTPKYLPGVTAGQVGFPFADINNLAFISGPSYDPGVLAGLTWTDIADGLSDPTNPATQAIVTTANYITASICASTKGQPGDVCTSSGVQAAAKALKLS